MEGLHEAEANVLAALGWDMDTVTGLDILYKLLSFATPQRAELLQAKAELAVLVAYCDRELSTIAPGDLAVWALLNACDQHDLDEAFLDFVPPFMLTAAARAGSVRLTGLLTSIIAPSTHPPDKAGESFLDASPGGKGQGRKANYSSGQRSNIPRMAGQKNVNVGRILKSLSSTKAKTTGDREGGLVSNVPTEAGESVAGLRAEDDAFGQHRGHREALKRPRVQGAPNPDDRQKALRPPDAETPPTAKVSS